jgi:hypothetical protein
VDGSTPVQHSIGVPAVEKYCCQDDPEPFADLIALAFRFDASRLAQCHRTLFGQESGIPHGPHRQLSTVKSITLVQAFRSGRSPVIRGLADLLSICCPQACTSLLAGRRDGSVTAR